MSSDMYGVILGRKMASVWENLRVSKATPDSWVYTYFGPVLNILVIK
jgi:hypothetical protein